MKMERFLEEQVPRLLHYLDNATPALICNSEVDAFIWEVEEVLEQVEGPRPDLRPWLPGEETFFWCLDQLAIIADPSNGYSRSDPWACNVVADLRELAPRLRYRQDLPYGRSVHFITPFDENHPEWDPVIDGYLDEAEDAEGEAGA
ncbi:MAG: hypothetical protein JJT88_10455 [Gammaproteobacteria bacterium]|nr:hypothetical protein [Gammaproteobacteria bacterium]